MAKLTDVFCTYTGGGIYVCSGKSDDVYFGTDFGYIGTYDVPYFDIEEKYDCDYDAHWKDIVEPLPTWGELLDAIRKSYHDGVSTNVDMGELERILRRYHPNLNVRMGEFDTDN